MEENKLVLEGMPMSRPGSVTTIEKLPLNKIKLNKNSRLNIDPDELSGLMQSIKSEGLLQPIGVVKDGNSYEVCYGNRRFLAVSKLGLNTIPAIVHQKKTEADVDIKNLTENVQRRNISLTEIGRYIEILRKQGLSPKEVGVRLGVSKSYVDSCINAFGVIPKEFINDLDVNVGNKKGKTTSAPGKISLSVANQAISAQKSGLIKKSEMTSILRAAKSDERFQSGLMPSYIRAISQGKKNFLRETKTKFVQVNFTISKTEYDRLHADYIDNGGPFKSMQQLVRAILSGKKHVVIKVLAK